MTEVPTSATRLIALLGNPVAHSISPGFQNAAFRHAGVDGIYLALRCEAAAVSGLIRGIAGAGGGGNVTVPHKEVAARSVDRGTEAVRRTGACNTYWAEDGQIWGDNTDVVGFARAIEALLAGPVQGARVLLVGGGGAARAALAALADARAGEVVLLNRTRARAETLASLFRDAAIRIRIADREDTLNGESFDLAVNATPLGLRPGDPLPLSPKVSERVGAGFDMVYRRGGTSWVRSLRAAGVPATDGSEMLLWQGAAAFERWWHLSAPVEVMRAAIEQATRQPEEVEPLQGE